MKPDAYALFKHPNFTLIPGVGIAIGRITNTLTDTYALFKHHNFTLIPSVGIAIGRIAKTLTNVYYVNDIWIICMTSYRQNLPVFKSGLLLQLIS